MALLTKDRSLYRDFFVLTAMIALQNIIVFSVNLADNIMIGAYSEDALAGISLANQVQFVLQMIINGAGEGIVVMASRCWGKGEIEPIKKIAACGMFIAVVCAILMGLFVFFNPTDVLSLFTNDIKAIAEGAKYIKIISFSYIFFAATGILLSSLRSVETVKIGFIVSLCALVINIVLNYTLIYGKFGMPELGSKGAAIATVIARIAEFFIIFLFIVFFEKKIHFNPKEFIKLDFTLLIKYIKIASPVILSGLSWGMAMSIQAGVLGRIGSAVAASSIAGTVFSILTVITYGSGSASSVIIGKTIGRGQLDKIREYTKTLQLLFLIIGISTGLGLFLIKDVILQFYVISDFTKELARQFMIVLSITVIGTSYQAPCLTGIVRGGGDTKFVLFNDLIFMWGIVLPTSIFAAFVWDLSPVIVFFCLKSDQILKCFVAIFKVNRFKWVKNLDETKKKLEIQEAK